AADRPDGEIHVFEPESVGGDLLQREALRGKLREGELARLEAVAARALDGDELHRDLLEREIGELLHFTLDHDAAALALEPFHAEQDRSGSGAGGAVESTSTPLPAVISMMRASGSSFSTWMVKSAPSSFATAMRARSLDVPVPMMSAAPACLQI